MDRAIITDIWQYWESPALEDFAHGDRYFNCLFMDGAVLAYSGPVVQNRVAGNLTPTQMYVPPPGKNWMRYPYMLTDGSDGFETIR